MGSSGARAGGEGRERGGIQSKSKGKKQVVGQAGPFMRSSRCSGSRINRNRNRTVVVDTRVVALEAAAERVVESGES